MVSIWGQGPRKPLFVGGKDSEPGGGAGGSGQLLVISAVRTTHGGLNANAPTPHRLISLNTWSQVGGTV